MTLKIESTKHKSPGARLTPHDQLHTWVEGKSLCPNTMGGHCPDFSCCDPELKVPKEVRESFLLATPSERYRFVFTFNGARMNKQMMDVRAKELAEVARA